MFQFLVVKPIFNLLVLIYALLPGHNFGLAIIVFTVVVRLLMWPLVKKQMHQTKAMREMQPQLKKIKQAAKGNKQQEQLMMMALYKERGMNPFSPIGTLIVQFIILIGLYSGLNRIVNDPKAIVDFSYSWLQDLSWLQALAADIGRFDNTLFGAVDLSRPALEKGAIYWPAMLLVLGSAAAQFYQSKQLMPTDKDARGLRQILREAGQGKSADAAETNAAVSRGMKFIIPVLIIVVTVGLASALSLYWLVGGVIAYIQQARALKQDEVELSATASANTKDVIEGEVIPPKPKKKASKPNKRRKKK